MLDNLYKNLLLSADKAKVILAATTLVTLCAIPSNAAVLGGETTLVGGEPCYTRRKDCPTPEDLLILDEGPAIVSDDLITPPNIVVFNEKQNFSLEENIEIWLQFVDPASDPKTTVYDVLGITDSDLQAPVISSHFFFLDPPDRKALQFTGTIEFSENIIGIIPVDGMGDEFGLMDTNLLLGLEDTTYNLNGRELDFVSNNHDRVTFSGNTLSFDVKTIHGMDPMRILTSSYLNDPSDTTAPTSVPEATSILGLLTAIGAGSILKRKQL